MLKSEYMNLTPHNWVNHAEDRSSWSYCSLPFYINCIFEDAWDGHGDKAGGDTRLHREMIVRILSKILLQTRCGNTCNNSRFGKKTK